MRFYQVFFAFLAHFLIDALRFRNTASDRGPEGGEGREIEQWRQFEGGGSRGPWLHATIGRAANNSVT